MPYRVALKALRNKEDARIAINSALMIRRRNKRLFEVSVHEAPDDEGSLPHPVDDGLTSEESCRHAELRDLLAEQINRLPSLIRTAFLLRDVDGFTTTESIKLLGINSSALKSRVQRARRRRD
jgi:RNA polymerase sigma-70 factor (ECF subfamily)